MLIYYQTCCRSSCLIICHASICHGHHQQVCQTEHATNITIKFIIIVPKYVINQLLMTVCVKASSLLYIPRYLYTSLCMYIIMRSEFSYVYIPSSKACIIYILQSISAAKRCRHHGVQDIIPIHDSKLEFGPLRIRR